jgi:hypothetical protein
MDHVFHQCASMAWSTKGINGLPLMVLCAFYRQKMLIALQRMHTDSILKHVIIVGEGSSKLTIFSSFVSLSFFICFLQLVGDLEHNLFLCPFVTHFGFLHL